MTDLARTDPHNAWVSELAPLPATAVDPVARLRAWTELFRDVYKASEVLAQTAFVPPAMKDNPANVAATIMKGFELGIDPLDALANFYVIHGRVGTYAEFQRRRIIQAGHKFRVVESSENRCIVEGIRRGETEPHRASFTAERARKAGIDLKAYPEDKLLARATSRLCKQAFPDVLSGSLIAEDLIDGITPTEPTPDTATPATGARAVLQRKRQPRKPKAVATQPPATTPPVDDDIDELLDPGGPPESDENPPVISGQRQRHDPPVEAESVDLSEPAATAQEPEVPACPNCGGSLELCEGGCTDITAAPPAEPAPEPQPEAELLDDENSEEPLPEPITPAQLKKLAILLREAGFDDRDTKLAFCTAAVNRTLTSSKELTINEASKLIDILESET